MFNRALITSLRIILLRAGPEDFPYDPGRQLTGGCVAFAFVAYMLFLMFVLSPMQSAAISAATVGGNWLLARIVLKGRKLENRLQQTFNALLVTTALLTVATIPAFAKVAPAALDMFAQYKQHPEIFNQPERWPRAAPGPSLVLDLLMIWQLVVCSRIFSRAADVGALGGVAITLLGGFGLMLLASLLAPLFGAG